MSISNPNTVLAILDRGAVSAVVRAVLGQDGRVTEVHDAVALTSAFERSAPDVLVVKSQIPWAPIKKLVSMVRRRWPACRVVVLGDAVDAEVAATVPVDLSGLAGLPELLARLLSTETIPSAMVDAPFGVLVGGGRVWRNDWLARTFPGVHNIQDLIQRADNATSIAERVVSGELVSFQVDDGSLFLDVMIVGEMCVVVPATTVPDASVPDPSQEGFVDPKSLGHDLIQPLRTAQLLLSKADEQEDAVARAMDVLDRMTEQVRNMTMDGDVVMEADLDEGMDVVLVMLEGAILEHGAKVEVRDPLGKVAMPQHQVEKVLQNLLSNAVRHGGPSVSVRVESQQHGEWVDLTIINDLKELLKKEESTGLGLNIVRKIMREAGGHFEFAMDSSSATATLRFPAFTG